MTWRSSRPGFTPHLSVGQARAAEDGRRLRDELQAPWQPLRFELTAIAVIERGPDSPFQLMRWVPLAAKIPAYQLASSQAAGRRS